MAIESLINYTKLTSVDFANHEMAGNPRNSWLKQNHEIAGITNCEITKCGDPLYYISVSQKLVILGFSPQIFFIKKNCFFCFILMKISPNLYGTGGPRIS